jgi:repressor LexA
MLEKLGRLSRERGISRGIASVLSSGLLIRGTIAAGDPLDLFDPGELEVLDLGEEVMITGAGSTASEVYALRVRGHSMIEDDILDRDYVLIAPCRSVPNGTIAVALERSANGGRGAATLKRVFVERGHVRLQPANSAVATRVISRKEWDRDWEVQGRLIGVYRCFDQHARARVAGEHLLP